MTERLASHRQLFSLSCSLSANPYSLFPIPCFSANPYFLFPIPSSQKSGAR
jgi:hypothetical protein